MSARLMQGNEAIAEGALKAGVRSYHAVNRNCREFSENVAKSRRYLRSNGRRNR